MADFDEMRLVFKVPEGYVWRCPCGLGAKAAVPTAGKARIGARDHINRRHPRNAPPEEAPPPDAVHGSGMLLEDAEALLDLAARHRVRCDIVAPREFQERSAKAMPGRFEPTSLKRIHERYPLADQVVLLWSEKALAPKVWLSAVDLLERRRYVVLFDVPKWDLPGPKAVLVAATKVPREGCMAYMGGDRKNGAGQRLCPNPAERITVATTSDGRQVRALLCKLHHRSQEGIDLGEEGGDSFVTFDGQSRPTPGGALAEGGVRPAAPRPVPTIPKRPAARAPAVFEPLPEGIQPPGGIPADGNRQEPGEAAPQQGESGKP